MAVREIRLYGDPVLTTPSAEIIDIDDGVRALVQDLLDTVKLPGRAGVAAPQIGVNLRAFSYNIDGDIGYVLNPRIVELRGEPQPTGEGCLSVPGLWHDALRSDYARVEGIDLDGNRVVLEGTGLMAQALQHETDHLDGMVYLRRLTPEDRKVAMKQVRESSWF
ncbi:peptide deformylase [Microbacterium mitrae]|uniref:Peptide deformylase n=1 Tax=Microbacterium mitrae TaxID=664640 RepID=A0A5C8HMR8_9MICO|nr:peptide deformylase [Microbacterium mitrae]TXK04746.1 peptide deformylase [Microbacterium mitrae]